MSQPARIAIRAPPHLPYIQGYPGIGSSSSSDRPSASVNGTVELRLGPTPIKAKWLRVEIRQHEGIPPGYPYPGEREGWKWIEGTDPSKSALWTPPAGQEFGPIEQKDYAFSIPLPASMPPSVDLGKGSGVKYELLACLCYKQKGGLFKSDALGYVKTSETLQIIKHEMHSAWAVYNQPDSQTIMGPHGSGVQMTVQRPSSAFGPGDRLLLTATMQSARAKQFKLKGFEAHLFEIITVIPPAPAAGPNGTVKKDKRKSALPNSKRRPIAMARFPVDEKIQPGGEKSARLDMTPPPGTLLSTTRGARTVKLEYELEIKSVCESGIPELKVMLEYTVGALGRRQAEQTVRDIGYVEELCPGVPPPSALNQPGPHNAFIPSFPPGNTQTPSPAGTGTSSVRPYSYFPPQTSRPSSGSIPRPSSASYPQQAQTLNPPSAVQGFLSSPDRRKSSASTITASTADLPRSPSMRDSRTVPRAVVAFPSPNPNPAPAGHGSKGLARANTAWTYRTSDSSLTNTTTTTPTNENGQATRSPSIGSGSFRSPRQGSASGGPTTPTGQDVHRFSASTFGRVDLGMSPSKAAGVRSSPPRTKSSPGNQPRIHTQQTATGPPSDLQPPPTRVLHSVTPISPVSSSTGPSSGRTPTCTLASSAAAGSPVIPIPSTNRSASGNAWPSAEQEKLRLYAEARSKAAATQAGAGQALDQIGLGDASSPPPDYEFSNARAGASTAAGASGSRSPVVGGAGVRSVSQPAPGAGPEASPIAAGGSSRFVAPAAVVGIAGLAGGSLASASAADKEAQRRRFDEAQRRVVSGPTLSSAAAAAAPSPAVGPGVPSTAASPAAPASGSRARGGVIREDGATQGTTRHATDAGVVLMNGDAPIPYDEIFPPGTPVSGGTAQSSPRVIQGVAEGQNAGASATASVAGQQASPRATGPMLQAPKVNGAGADKDQMKRYYEAQDRVNRAAGGSSSAPTTAAGGSATEPVAAPGPSSSTRTNPPPHAGQVGGGSEKDQMKRYYEAQDKVARASTLDQPGMAPNKTAGPGPSTTGGGGVPVNQVDSSAQAEKDQMKRYYAAQDRVALAQSQVQGPASGPGSTSEAGPAVPPKDTGSPVVPSFSADGGSSTTVQNGGGPSASQRNTNGTGGVNEKDQMRRYYEAQDRVAAARAGTAPAPDNSPPGPSSSTIPAAQPSTGFFTAEQEKDAMRQRYEQATASVSASASASASAGQRSQTGPTSTLAPPTSGRTKLASPLPTQAIPGGLTENTNDSPLSMYSQASFLPPSHAPGQNGMSSMQARAAAPGAPPPPLPSRPPQDYVRLLSPDPGEQARRMARGD